VEAAARPGPGPGSAEAGERQRRYADLVLLELPVLLRVARTMTGQPADAEDLVQDTLLRAWRALDTFDGRHPRAWLLTVMRHTEINRHRRRRPELLDDPDTARRLQPRRRRAVRRAACPGPGLRHRRRSRPA